MAFFPGGGRGCSSSVPYLFFLIATGRDVGNPGDLSPRGGRGVIAAVDCQTDSGKADGMDVLAVNRKALFYSRIMGIRGGGPGGHRWFTGYSDTEEEEEEEDADCRTEYETEEEADSEEADGLSQDREQLVQADCEDEDKGGEDGEFLVWVVMACQVFHVASLNSLRAGPRNDRNDTLRIATTRE